MKPRISPTELQDRTQYRLIEEFDQFNLFKFLSIYYYQKRSWITYFHSFLSLLALTYWILFGIKANYSLATYFFTFGWAMASMVVIFIPLNEIVHLIAYRIIGARQVRFYFSFKKIYALTIPYDLVITRVEAIWADVYPFILLTSAILVASVCVESTRFYFLSILAIYLGLSSKDFANVNYYWLNRQKILYRYDGFDGKRYIYEKICNT